MSDIDAPQKTDGNIITNNRVVLWKGTVGTFIVLGSTILATLSGNDWSAMSGTQHFIAIVAIAIAGLKNIESLLTDTKTPPKP